MSGSLIAATLFGVVLTAIAFAHPIGPGLMLAAETPFDAIPFALFGVVGNSITYVPILIFLIKVNPAYWGQVFLGTRIQQYTALFFLSLIVCHAMGIVDYGLGQIFEWLRKVTLFVLIGVFAQAMRERYMGLLVKTMVVAMTTVSLLSMSDFYLGIQILPLKAGYMEGAALETEFQSHLATAWRFTAPGMPVNRYANYLLLMIFLGFGWFMRSRNPFQRATAISCVVVLILAEIFTVSRAAIGGLVIGILLMLPLAMRFRVQHLVGIVVVGATLGALAWYAASYTAAADVISMRFEPTHLLYSTGGRIERIFAAVLIWADHPFFGVGWSAFKEYSVKYVAVGGKGSHNGYMAVLAQAGLLGFIPLAILTVAVLRRAMTRVGHLSTEYEFWRPYFLCALIAQLFTNIFNDYLWERYFWVTVAFTVVLEQCHHGARAKEARSHLEHMRSLGTPRPSTDPAGAGVGAS